MAKSTTKTKGQTFGVRRVRSKEDRKRPSVFMRLKAEEKFAGHALFEPDPEVEDNPGYFEYYDHYDNQANTYVPCAGEACPFCAANDNPSTRAMTTWYFPENEGKERIKVFTMNFGTTQDLADEAEEEDGILGKKIRVKRMDDRGAYRVKILAGKPLTKKQLTEAQKLMDEILGEDGLEGFATRQLKTQMERLKAIDALDDDDDEDEEPTAEVEEEEEEDEEDEEEEDEEEEEEEEDEEEEEEEEEDEDEEEEAETTMSVEVVKADENSETFDVKIDGKGKKVKMYVGSDLEPEYDDFKKGTTATITAGKDDDDDWVITSIEPKKKSRKSKK